MERWGGGDPVLSGADALRIGRHTDCIKYSRFLTACGQAELPGAATERIFGRSPLP
jgi:hypothetical protein